MVPEPTFVRRKRVPPPARRDCQAAVKEDSGPLDHLPPRIEGRDLEVHRVTELKREWSGGGLEDRDPHRGLRAGTEGGGVDLGGRPDP